jgi:HAE1 family hydrophobic/amphiphilic exporter-1
LYGAHTAYNIQANGQLMHAEDYRPLVVAWRNGAPIRLDEVANVIDSIENRSTSLSKRSATRVSHP